MKIIRIAVATAALLVLVPLVGCGGGNNGHAARSAPRPASVEALMDQVLLAIKQQDRDKLQGLCCWDGVDEDLRAQHGDVICKMLLGMSVREACIEEASANDAPWSADEHYVFTVPVSRHIVLKPVDAKPFEDVTIHLYAGQDDGGWCLAAPRRGRPGEPQPAVVIDKYTGPAANPRPEGGPEKYEVVEIGMSRDKVFDILGNIMVHKKEPASGTPEVYEWEYRGGTITVGFTDGVAKWKSTTFVNR